MNNTLISAQQALRDIPGFVGAVAGNLVVQEKYADACTYLLGAEDVLALMHNDVPETRHLLKLVQTARALVKALRDEEKS